MQQLSKWNKGYKYLLMVIDIFSKYGWIVPLKDKKGETVTKAFQQIFKEGLNQSIYGLTKAQSSTTNI